MAYLRHIICTFILVDAALAQASQNGLKVKSQKAVPSQLHVQRTKVHSVGDGDRKTQVVFSHREGVYCADNWDHDHVKLAQKNNVDAETCMKQCEENPDCVGVSVTNEGWGERPPWCHLCVSRGTRTHQNLDTYWMDELTPMEVQYRDLRDQANVVELVEASLCENPKDVSRSDFEKVKQQEQVHASLKETQEKCEVEKKEYNTQLEEEHAAAVDGYKQAVEKAEVSAANLEQGKEGVTKADVETAKKNVQEKDDNLKHISAKIQRHSSIDAERAALDEELKHLTWRRDFIEHRLEALTEKHEVATKDIDRIKKQMKELDKQAEKEFWDNWLAR